MWLADSTLKVSKTFSNCADFYARYRNAGSKPMSWTAGSSLSPFFNSSLQGSTSWVTLMLKCCVLGFVGHWDGKSRTRRLKRGYSQSSDFDTPEIGKTPEVDHHTLGSYSTCLYLYLHNAFLMRTSSTCQHPTTLLNFYTTSSQNMFHHLTLIMSLLR